MKAFRQKKLFLLLACVCAVAAGSTLGMFVPIGRAGAPTIPDVGSLIAAAGLGTKVDSYTHSLGAQGITGATSSSLSSHGVYVTTLSDGELCILDARSGVSDSVGGCNASSTPLGGSTITASLAYDGGPSLATVSNARIFGLAAANVASVALVMSDGSSRPAPLSSATKGLQVFAVALSPADISAGVTPVAVASYDAKGNQLSRATTGFNN